MSFSGIVLAWLQITTLLGFPLVAIFCIRLIQILPTRNSRSPRRFPATTSSSILIVLGSGGHTTEMLNMLETFSPQNYHLRIYIVSSNDQFSAARAQKFEQSLVETHSKLHSQKSAGSYTVLTVPRARNIHQSLLTTPYTAIKCWVSCIQALYPSKKKRTVFVHEGASPQRLMTEERVISDFPDVVVCNGPATGAMVVFAALLYRFFSVPGSHDKLHLIYVETWARVNAVSFSGRILEPFVDRFFVQWPTLRQSYLGKREYRGALVR